MATTHKKEIHPAMKRTIKVALAVLVALGLGFTLTACDEDRTLSVPQSFCGFLQGNGGRDHDNHDNDANVTQVLYEGQSAQYKSDQRTGYVFPCVQRNYIVATAGGDTNAALRGLTLDGVPVYGYVSAYWQPNQLPEPLKQFIGFCQGKYGCAATDSKSFTGEGATNASTPGWNKMLAENMWPVLQRTFERAVATVPNAVWQAQDPKLRQQVADAMSAAFAAEFQKVTGATADLICGAGSTGQGQSFDCKQILVYVDSVVAQNQQQQDGSNASKAADAQRKLDQDALQADLDLTNAKYGPLAPAYRACRDLGQLCKFVTGDKGAVVQTS